MKQDPLPIPDKDPCKVCVVCHREVKTKDEYGSNYEIKSIDDYRWWMHNACYNLLITIFQIQIYELGDELMQSTRGIFGGKDWRKRYIRLLPEDKQKVEAKQTA